MRLRNWLLIAAMTAALMLGWAIVKLKNDPTEVQFGKAIRGDLHTAITTNGKVEPIDWAVARADRAGPVVKISVQRGEPVAKDQVLVEMDSSEARAALASAQARMTVAKSEMDTIERGGRATELAEIASGLEKAHHDLTVAQDEHARAQRLEAKQAGTHAEVIAAKERIDQAQIQIDTLEKKRRALAATGDRSAAQARFDDAKAAAQLAETQIAQSIVRAPLDGTVYQFDLKPGAYLNAGDPVAYIGKLDRVKVNVDVDEPDLGHVAVGMPVMITWDALAGRQWPGEVDKKPTEVVTRGTRQVGEVICVIKNSNRDLLPGTNVNVEIRSSSISNVVTVPKEAVRTEHGEAGVYTLAGSQLVWKPVKTGLANTTRMQVEGLAEGAAVAVFSEKPLHDAEVVKAVFPQ